MKYLVIGLGNLGRAIAESLTRIGNEVIGVDINPHKTEAVKHTISGAISLDTTDKDALNTLPLNEMDAIFVTFGKDFGTSIQTVALLKNLDVNKLIVRGISPIHEAVIRSIGVAEIITPEDDFAGMYASQSLLGELFKQWYRVTDTHHLYKIKAPVTFVGQTLQTIDLEENFGKDLTEKVQQNFKGLSSQMYLSKAWFKKRKIVYNYNPVLLWCLLNTEAVTDTQGNVKPYKNRNLRKRIDGYSSLLDAFCVYLDHKDEI